jgi:pimeloyl-ACP methyl ester carboxylesterase/DNA-binding CsgD family transcriptional regulator
MITSAGSLSPHGAPERDARPPDSGSVPGPAGPSIHYSRTADGVAVAFWTLGRGTPLVYLTGGPWSHVELWQIPECRRWYERLAVQRMLVRYDQRGTGLSERSVSDYSLEALLLDVEAVVDRLCLDRFALFGAADAGPVAIAYAARHPERVSRLVLWCAWARGADVASSPRIRAWRELLDRDWELMTETCAHLALGWSAGEIGRRAAERLRESVTREGLQAAFDAAAGFDTTPLLPAVAAPALVLHRRDIAWLPVSIARDLASRLQDPRLGILEGESTAPYIGDTEPVAQAIDAFLGEPDQAAVPPEVATEGVTRRGDGLPMRSPGDGLPLRANRDLTQREIEVVGLLARGQTNQEIADHLVVSVRTVERHISNIYHKLGARGRAHATAYALTRGLV